MHSRQAAPLLAFANTDNEQRNRLQQLLDQSHVQAKVPRRNILEEFNMHLKFIQDSHQYIGGSSSSRVDSSDPPPKLASSASASFMGQNQGREAPAHTVLGEALKRLEELLSNYQFTFMFTENMVN